MDAVEVWHLPLAAASVDGAALAASLSADERARADRFAFPELRRRYVLAHARLREILATYVDAAPHTLRFHVGPKGKPGLQDAPGLEFNLSHCDAHALLAVAHGRAVGIDIEQARRIEPSDGVAEVAFSTHERAALAALPPSQREAGFFRIWVRKEAYIKAHGLGMAMPLQDFDVAADALAARSVLATRPDPVEARKWWLLDLPAPAPCVAALVVARAQGESDPPPITWRTRWS